MKQLLLIFAILSAVSCSSRQSASLPENTPETTVSGEFILPESESFVDGVYTELTKSQFLKIMETKDIPKYIELTDLYEDSNAIPDDEEEELFTYHYFIEQGFESLDWGRGNWQYGPRFIHCTLKKGNKVLQVGKFYHTQPDSEKYRITERIIFLN